MTQPSEQHFSSTKLHSPALRIMASPQKPRVTQSSGLPTPGTPLADDFDQIMLNTSKAQPPMGLTTPVSPAFETFNAMETGQGQDDVLYPDYEKSSPSEKPLFESVTQEPPSPNCTRPATATSTPGDATSEYNWQSFQREVGSGYVDTFGPMTSHPGYLKALQNENRKWREIQRRAREKTLPPLTASNATPRLARDPHDDQQLALLPPKITHLVRKHKPYSCPSMTGPIIGMPAGTPDGPPLSSDEETLASVAADVAAKNAKKAASKSTSKSKKRTNAHAFDNPTSPISIKKTKIESKIESHAGIISDETGSVRITSSKRRNRQNPETTSNVEIHSSSAQQAKAKTHTRAHPTKAVDNFQDSQWQQLDDFSPDVAMLDLPNAKRLRAVGNSPLDLSDDPSRKFLHSQELELAASLRLPCQQYLINKRRIFLAKVKCLQEDKNFNKTACQQCTNMDVNKASKLWTAYNEVGWFDAHHFARFRT